MMTAPHELEDLLLELLPEQGHWGEEQYLWLTDDTSRLIEFTDGAIEVLPMPTDEHQPLSQFLLFAFQAAVQPRGGVIRYSPLRLRIRPRKFREPDLLLLLDAGDPRRENRYWLGADLVLEIISPDNPERDLVDKRFDYAEAAIPEYWIVNPKEQSVTVLRLDNDSYTEHGIFVRGQHATSPLLPGLAVDVAALFDAK
jgi:Uma2 family endonuclease